MCQAPLGQLVLAPAVVWDSTQPTRRSGGGDVTGGSDASCRQITVDICCRYVDSHVLREQLGPTTRVICRFRECVAVAWLNIHCVYSKEPRLVRRVRYAVAYCW